MLDDIDVVPEVIYTMYETYVDSGLSLTFCLPGLKRQYSISESGTLVRVYDPVKMDIGQLVTEPQPLIPNQDSMN